jgi:hypothetical protein
MIGLLLENEADCLILQHTEPRGGPPMNRTRWPEPPTARAVSLRAAGPIGCHASPTVPPRSLALSKAPAARERCDADLFCR